MNLPPEAYLHAVSTVWKFYSEEQNEKYWKERYILENLETVDERKSKSAFWLKN